jgi:hypothetical protein
VTHIVRLIFASIGMLAFTAPVSSNSVESMPDTAKARQGSIVYLGRPLDCAVDVCPKKAAAAPAAAAKPSAMVDAFGMPMPMPTLLRGGKAAEEPAVILAAPAEKTGDAPAAPMTKAPAGQKEVK